eukprot:TRINITY_DN39408_c0_g1_i1.p1 TRINITY_DN39408_c0_g1~~TRINITY_DN39408_c0_g1_i1.p1  ORF type:complete len:1532 (+),score=293.07 TRINITY_DN39408_c0_g1_i1:66-4661(+)
MAWMMSSRGNAPGSGEEKSKPAVTRSAAASSNADDAIPAAQKKTPSSLTSFVFPDTEEKTTKQQEEDPEGLMRHMLNLPASKTADASSSPTTPAVPIASRARPRHDSTESSGSTARGAQKLGSQSLKSVASSASAVAANAKAKAAVKELGKMAKELSHERPNVEKYASSSAKKSAASSSSTTTSAAARSQASASPATAPVVTKKKAQLSVQRTIQRMEPIDIPGELMKPGVNSDLTYRMMNPGMKPPTTKRKQGVVFGKRGQNNVEEDAVNDAQKAAREAVATYGEKAFEKALAEGMQRHRSVKLCFVGHARAGKTSTLKSLAGRDFDPAQASTHGVATCSLANELLAGPAGGTADAAWDTIEGASAIGDLLEKAVAEKCSDFMRCLQSGEQAAGGGEQQSSGDTATRPPASGSSAPAGYEASEKQSCSGQGHDLFQVLKMPVDLIVNAVSDGQGAQETVVMQTWDFAGQEMYYSMAHVFLTPHGIYVLAIDLSLWAQDSVYEDVIACDPCRDIMNSLDFWLAAIHLHAPDAYLVIVGTHDDALPEDVRADVHARVNDSLAQQLEKMPALSERLQLNKQDDLLFFPIDNSRSSSSGKQSIDVLRKTINTVALTAVSEIDPIKTSWAHFFYMLTGLKRSHLGREECEALAEPFKLELDAFLQFFHSLGQVLYFEGSPAVVLEPQWLLDAMAHVVACPRAVSPHLVNELKKRGELGTDLLETLWADERFKAHNKTLLAFLQHFDLMIPVFEDTSRWLVPSLLPRHQQRREAVRAGPVNANDKSGATVYLDFHGALKRLVPSLLPRLLSHLRHHWKDAFTVSSLFQDFALCTLGQRGDCILSLETIPHLAPVLLKVSLRLRCDALSVSADSASVLASTMDALLAEFGHCLHRWLPRLSYSTQVPCPICRAAEPDTSHAQAVLGSHMLELADLLATALPLCTEACVFVTENALPSFLKSWRCLRLASTKPSCEEGRGPCQGTEDAARGDAARTASPLVVLRYMYASPLISAPSTGGKELRQLDILAEMEGLGDVWGLHGHIAVGTSQSLRDALTTFCPKVAQRGLLPVVHLSCHCSGLPVPAVMLEDSSSASHSLTREELAACGPWDSGLLLVFLSCGSQFFVNALLEQHGLRHAICCNAKVIDAAARMFCRALYGALVAGQSPKDACSLAQAAIRSSPDPGLRSEAEKFHFLECSASASLSSAPDHGSDLQQCLSQLPPWQRWPRWSRVEDYVARIPETVLIARFFASRRFLLLQGDHGLGKTALCQEFCHHFVAPGGRLFSAGAFMLHAGGCSLNGDLSRESLTRALLVDIQARDASVHVPPSENNDAPAGELQAWRDLRAVVAQLDARGKWLLVVKGVTFADEQRASILASFLEGLLTASALLCVIMTSTQSPAQSPSWQEISGLKLCSMELSKLSPHQAARLFYSRVRRKLTLKDFDVAVLQSGGTTAPVFVGPEGKAEALKRLKESNLLHALNGNPKLIVNAAAQVDDKLPSLLLHPALPDAWKPAGIIGEAFAALAGNPIGAIQAWAPS